MGGCFFLWVVDFSYGSLFFFLMGRYRGRGEMAPVSERDMGYRYYYFLLLF